MRMRLPEPQANESREAFIARCMEELSGEYADENQRMAVAAGQWEAQQARSIEYRGTPEGTELRAAEDGEAPRIEGYAAVFNKLSQPLGFGFREKILPGAFTTTVKNGDVRALFNHDPNHVLGRTKAGTLELREDERGLYFTAHPPDEPWVRSLITSIKRGDINQASFSFQTINESWSESGKTRELHEVRLYDVSPVTYPAYLDTLVQARSMKQAVAQALAAMAEPKAPKAPQSERSDAADPEQLQSDTRTETAAGPEQLQPDEVQVRKLSVLVKEWRVAKEAGEATLKQLEEVSEE